MEMINISKLEKIAEKILEENKEKEDCEKLLVELQKYKAHKRLDCLFSDKEIVKEKGAFWSHEGKYWYVTNQTSFINCFKWIPIEDKISKRVYEILLTKKTITRRLGKNNYDKQIDDIYVTKKQKTIKDYFN